MNALLKAVEEDPDNDIRQLALVSLGHLDSEVVFPLLTRVASVGADTEERIGALLTLRRVSGLITFDALLTALREDPGEQVRAAAAEILGKRRDPKALPFLERGKKREPSLGRVPTPPSPGMRSRARDTSSDHTDLIRETDSFANPGGCFSFCQLHPRLNRRAAS
ncbi:HEAT repeat domain-containing protein [bacterium]|nr:HEAT repeat domain-containing protein [bacterium]